MIFRRFNLTHLDGVEDAEDYQPGGFHPIAIGDRFSQGRYRVVHKLGYGGSSTVWLARDGDEGDKFVALKALRADASSKETHELIIREMLRAALPPLVDIQTINGHFFVHGPNGSHLFLVSPFAGPSLFAMSVSPNRTAGSRRLRADLARKVAHQIAEAVYYMHSVGVVHGDLTTSNILFSLSPHVLKWTDAELYANLGEPRTSEVVTTDRTPRPACAPAKLVAPIDNSKLTDASFLLESVILCDFGQSYVVASPPQDYVPATIRRYCSPETRFEKRAGCEADVWALGCVIFEIRAGCSLIEPFMQTDAQLVAQTIRLLGRLPDPWWSAYEERTRWFEEDGEPKSVNGIPAQVLKTSIRKQLRIIGVGDQAPLLDDGPMIEASGVHLREEEIELLGDLLEKILKYRPEERITMDRVVKHPWFAGEMFAPKYGNAHQRELLV